MIAKRPSAQQWGQFFKVLGKRERFSFFLLSFLFFTSLSFLLGNFYFEKTKVVPASGGTYIEGVVGSPLFINPLYSAVSDVDRDLTELIFSGLMKYDSSGVIQLDLAKNYNIFENGKIYEFHLKKDILWEDSEPLTVDDIIFTIETIKNSEAGSPLRPMWLGVETIKISDFVLRFTLKNPSSVFLENCTLKIIPEHIWKDVSLKNFRLTRKNLNPIGSGPYKLEDLFQDSEGKILSLDLVKNPLYFNEDPHLSKISFLFFETEEELITAYEEGKIKGFSLDSTNSLPETGSIYSFSIPRYFSVFFNQDAPEDKAEALAEKKVRMALTYGTNKKELLETILLGQGKIINSPILPNVYGFKNPLCLYEYNVEEANSLLDQAGYLLQENGFREKTIKKDIAFKFEANLSVGSRGSEVTELQKCLANPSAGGPEIYPEGKITGYFGSQTKAAVIKFQEKYRSDVLSPFGLTQGTGDVKSKTREKLNEVCFEDPEEKIPLKFSLLTVDQPLLMEIATLLKNQWGLLGVDVDVQTFDINIMKRDILRKREFEALLFGEILSLIPDPFPFWHSSQKGEIGLNLTDYENTECDKLLETNRKSLEATERQESLEEFQNLLLKDCPAIFLYTPDYRYFVSEEIQGISTGILADSSKRFSEIGSWYIHTKRAWK